MGQHHCHCAVAEKICCDRENEVNDNVLHETVSALVTEDQRNPSLIKDLPPDPHAGSANYLSKNGFHGQYQEEPQFFPLPPPAAEAVIKAPPKEVTSAEQGSFTPVSSPGASPRSPTKDSGKSGSGKSKPIKDSGISGSGKSKADKTKAVKAMVNEFLAVAKSDSGIPCKVYLRRSSGTGLSGSSVMLTTAQMHTSVDATVIKLSLDCSEQTRELPLVSTRVYDSEKITSQSSLFDSDIVKALLHQDAGEHVPLSIMLVTPEETLCVVLPDEEMMYKSQKSFTILSDYLRDKAAAQKVKEVPSEASTTAGSGN